MQDQPIGKIIRIVRPIESGDSITRAAEAMRASGLTALPVVSGTRFVGMVREDAVLDAVLRESGNTPAGNSVSTVMARDFVSLNAYSSVAQAADVMADRGLTLCPVLNEHGDYLGVVTRSDVIGALNRTIRPPTIGGLATPLGVYLTTGQLRAGASDFGLFLTGISIGLLMLAANGAVSGLSWLVQSSTSLPLMSMLNSPVTGTGYWMDYVRYGLYALTVLFFALFLRLSPLSGYHAAEHQVVHAIEQGEILKPEHIRSMPRAHPRCGTNLLIGVMVFMMITRFVDKDVAVLIALFVLIFAWRIVGAFFQNLVTTKSPSDKQLASGIRAGEELLELYREDPTYRVTGLQRVRNLGMIQVMLGMLAMEGLRPLLQSLLPWLYWFTL